MAKDELQQIREFIHRSGLPPGQEVVLAPRLRPREHGRPLHQEDSTGCSHEGVELLADYQSRLAAQDTYGLLVVLQALDAGGKDSTIRHVMSGVNPQGVGSTLQGASAEELDHDYLWRYAQRLPARGEIGIFNRSHYEEVLVVRVHPEFLERAEAPAAPRATGDVWERRYRQINDWERHLVENGFPIVKFFLHVSKEEQRRRFLARIDDPEKNWKFSAERRQGARALGRVPGSVLRDAQRRRAPSTRPGT